MTQLNHYPEMQTEREAPLPGTMPTLSKYQCLLWYASWKHKKADSENKQFVRWRHSIYGLAQRVEARQTRHEKKKRKGSFSRNECAAVSSATLFTTRTRLQNKSSVGEDVQNLQENMWARLRDSCPGVRAIHAT